MPKSQDKGQLLKDIAEGQQMLVTCAESLRPLCETLQSERILLLLMEAAAVLGAHLIKIQVQGIKDGNISTDDFIPF